MEKIAIEYGDAIEVGERVAHNGALNISTHRGNEVSHWTLEEEATRKLIAALQKTLPHTLHLSFEFSAEDKALFEEMVKRSIKVNADTGTMR